MIRSAYLYISIVILLVTTTTIRAQDLQRVIELEGRWKFSIGDNRKWATNEHDDSGWERIYVPGKWEDEGFHGYDGYAWYRTTFDGNRLMKGQSFILSLGYIDDVDEVYLNGNLIGASGSFPQRYRTAFNAPRKYHIPSQHINFSGKNVIAVRVFDEGGEGGIVHGDIAIFSNREESSLAVNLRGVWDFATVHNGRFYRTSEINYSRPQQIPTDLNWTKISVPMAWENQGYHDYDGIGWYRKQFEIPKSLAGEDLILLLGKIDDRDQAYFNGELVGFTMAHDKLRAYHIPASLLNAGGFNLLMVFVEDLHISGGIYEGPVGLMKQTDFTRFVRYRKK